MRLNWRLTDDEEWPSKLCLRVLGFTIFEFWLSEYWLCITILGLTWEKAI